MSRSLVGVGLAVVLLAVGFVAGRASGGVDDRALRDSLAVYRDHRTADRAALDSSRLVIAAAQLQTRQAEADAAEWRAKARAGTTRANQHQARADSLFQVLALAPTAADSLPILVRACTELRQECAALRAVNADLSLAIEADSVAKNGLRRELGAHLQQRGRDSTRLGEADGLIRKLAKAARGCRYPFVGFPCIEGVASYSLDDQAFRFGGSVPLKLGPLGRVNLSIITKVGGGKP